MNFFNKKQKEINSKLQQGFSGGTGGISNNNYSSYYKLKYATIPPNQLEKFFCELCGDEINDASDDIEPILCEPCETILWRKLVKEQIPEGSKVHCPICSKHINACQCPESESLRQMAE